MKVKLLFIIVAFVCLNKINAQTNIYHPFPNSNAVWRVNSETWGSGLRCSFYQYTIGGDTIISSYTYKKIYQSGFSYCGAICGGGVPPSNLLLSYCSYSNQYQGALRQDSINKTVYYINTGYQSSQEILLYDFSKSIGDTVYVGGGIYNVGPAYAKIDSIDSVLVGNNYRKKFNVSVSANPGNYPASSFAIVEGLGSANGLLESNLLLEYSANLTCFTHYADNYPYNDTTCKLLLPNGTFSTLAVKQLASISNQFYIYPNPNNGTFKIQSNTSEKAILTIYDVTSKQVLSQTINGTTSIDASNLTEGVYNISIINNQGITNKRLVIVK